MASPVVPPSSIRQPQAAFLLENAPHENLLLLSSPKLSAAPATSCLTRTVYRKIPYFKPSRERIQAKMITGTVGAAVFGIASRIFWGTGICVAAQPQWFENFFANSSDCFARTIKGMIQPGSLLTFIFQTSVIGLCGMGAYLGARICFADYQEIARLQLLGKEYSAIAESLKRSFEKQNENPPNDVKTIQGIAYRLKANLLLIEANLKKTGCLSPEDASRFTRQLSLSADRVLNPEGAPNEL
jgi:hypothetical protein